MAPLNSLFGNGSKDREVRGAADELRVLLDEARQERERFTHLIEKSSVAAVRLEALAGPVESAGADAEEVLGRLKDADEQLEAVRAMTAQVQALEERAETLARIQSEAQARLGAVTTDSQRVREVFEELSAKVDLAGDLKQRLEAFLEIEKPFQVVREDVGELRGQLEATSAQLGRMREQNDRLADAQKLAMSKMEALDRRREEFSRDLQDKERRVLGAEQSIRGMDGVRGTIDDVKRELGGLKSTADSLSQKITALASQREAVDRALSQAGALEQASRQFDAGMQQHRESARALGAMQDDVNALHSLHEETIERSREGAALLKATEEQVGFMRQELTAARDEARNSVERFDFESKGLESVSQRVADLRGALTEFENRYNGLRESSQTLSELNAQTRGLVSQIEALAGDARQIEGETRKLHAMRETLDASHAVAAELGAKVTRIEEARASLETALRDLTELGGAQALVRDTLEQSQAAHREITRMRDAQAEVRSWLLGTEQTLFEMKEQVVTLREMAPVLQRAETQAKRVGESMSAIESRQQFVDELHRRLAEAGALGAQLDDRGRQLQSRMEAAEQRFLSLNERSEEAAQISLTVDDVTASVQETSRKVESLGQLVASFEDRCLSVEEIAGRTQSLREEIEQRQMALEDAAKKLAMASKLRQESATAAQELQQLSSQLGEAVATAETRAGAVGELSGKLEARVADLRDFDRRLGAFEQRLARWEGMDENVSRSLEQITARQDTVKSLRTDLDRMFTLAERTSTEVRAITAAHREVEESRALLDDVMARLRDIGDTESSLDERQRQLHQAEDRLARSEGLLADVRSGLEAVQGQKAIIEQAVEKTGSLKFLLKQAEGMIESLRDERSMTTDVREAVALVDSDEEYEDDEEEGHARAA